MTNISKFFLRDLSLTSLASHKKCCREQNVTKASCLVESLKVTEVSWLSKISLAPVSHHTKMLSTISLNLSQKRHPCIWGSGRLAHDCKHLVPLPAPVGGVVVVSSTAIMYRNHGQVCVCVAVAGCCRVLQGVAGCYGVSLMAGMYRKHWQVCVCCRVLRCCRLLQYVVDGNRVPQSLAVLQCVTGCCRVLQGVARCVLQDVVNSNGVPQSWAGICARLRKFSKVNSAVTSFCTCSSIL